MISKRKSLFEKPKKLGGTEHNAEQTVVHVDPETLR
jgi:hypothetical protein